MIGLGKNSKIFLGFSILIIALVSAEALAQESPYGAVARSLFFMDYGAVWLIFTLFPTIPILLFMAFSLHIARPMVTRLLEKCTLRFAADIVWTAWLISRDVMVLVSVGLLLLYVSPILLKSWSSAPLISAFAIGIITLVHKLLVDVDKSRSQFAISTLLVGMTFMASYVAWGVDTSWYDEVHEQAAMTLMERTGELTPSLATSQAWFWYSYGIYGVLLAMWGIVPLLLFIAFSLHIARPMVLRILNRATLRLAADLIWIIWVMARDVLVLASMAIAVAYVSPKNVAEWHTGVLIPAFAIGMITLAHKLLVDVDKSRLQYALSTALVGATLVASFIPWGVDTTWMDENSEKLEMMLAPGAVYAMAASSSYTLPASLEEYKNLTNPVPATKQSLFVGKLVYTAFCVECHGSKGDGNGKGTAGMVPRPSDFTDSTWKYGGSDGDIIYTIAHGVKSTTMPAYMPNWNTTLSVEQQWHVLNYIKTLSSGRKK